MYGLKWLPLCLLFMLVAGCTAEVTEKVPQQEYITELRADETIIIPFHTPIDAATITEERVLLTYENGERINRTVTVRDDGQTLHVAPSAPLQAGNYTLTITPNVLATNGQPLVASNYTKKYTVPIRYRVEQWRDGAVHVVGTFATREQADAAMTEDAFLFDYNEAIVIPNGQGQVITSQEGITKLYNDESFTTSSTYVAGSSELRFLEKTDAYIKVLAANDLFYIEPQQLAYVPFYMERTHYTVEDGQLLFHVRNYRTHETSTFAVSEAPPFLQQGQRYYSDDGYTFYDETGTDVGMAPTYFQFLSLRSTTSYSAEQLDAYIVEMLKNRERNGGQYVHASTTSKLLGLGTLLKKVEAEMHINALLILALAQHESDYGMSNHAQTYNNLFGLYVFDSNPANKEFASIEANVYELTGKFLNKNYIPPTAGYANGAYFGNKVQGVNVKYASDQYWGAKAAGHAYRIDRALGGHDINRYELLQVNDAIFAQKNKLTVYADAQATTSIYAIPNAHGRFVTAFKEPGNMRAIVSHSGRYAQGYIDASVITNE